MRYLLFILVISFLTGCSSSHKVTGNTINSEINEIRLINEYRLPDSMLLKNTVVGGLSGIDYDAKRDLYYMICDDPSSKGPTRFYTAKIMISDKGIDSVEMIDVTALQTPSGQPFPDITKDRIHSADVEAMRYDASRDELIWTSEGQRVIRQDTQLLQDPSIVIMDRSGRYKDSFALPANMHIHSTEAGPRHNSVFEGVAFDETYHHVYVSVEEPIYEDGPRAGLGADSTAWIRILKFNRKLKEQVAQFAYKIDPVPFPPNPPTAFRINGVSDIMYIGNEKFIVIERGFSIGRAQSDIRIYLADAKGAEDISHIASLKTYAVKKPVTKKLLLDMSTLNRFVDNIEGVTFGPLLSNGHRSLVFVVDNNFDNKQKNQFFLFEVVP